MSTWSFYLFLWLLIMSYKKAIRIVKKKRIKRNVNALN